MEHSASTSAAAAAADVGTSSAEVRVGEERKGNCVVAFDALWFCYSPVYQMQQYYIHGRVDDCSSKWSDLVNCLKRKTTKYKDEVLAADAEQRHPLWDIRTHAEAAEAWQQEFGHVSGEGGGAAAGEEAPHRGETTLV